MDENTELYWHPNLGEDAVPLLLVDHLDDSDDDPSDADGHAQDRLGHVPAHTVEATTLSYTLVHSVRGQASVTQPPMKKGFSWHK